MTDYALPVTGTGTSQAASVDDHNAEVQRAIDEAMAALAQTAGGDAARPGTQIAAFGVGSAGAPSALGDLATQAGVSVAPVAGLGEVLIVEDVKLVVAPRTAHAVQPGRVYRLHAYVQRLVDPADPVGDTVRVALRRLDADYAALATLVVEDHALTVADGLRHVSATFALDPGLAGVDHLLPEGTVYIRPQVRFYGTDHRTAPVQLEIVDITEAAQIDGALDVLTLEQAVGDAEAAADRAERMVVDAAQVSADRAIAEAAAANAQSSALTCATWAVLSGLTGATAGTGAEVLDTDTGTHTDPVAGGTVPNAGRYTWSASPAGWHRIGGTGLSGKVPQTFQATDATVETDEDPNGRWWLQKRTDGTVRIQKLADATGNRLDIAIADSADRIADLEAASLLQPPIRRLRLKKSLYYGGLQGRQTMASDPITVGSTTTATTMTSPVAIAKDDPRIRLLGGPWYDSAAGYPANLFKYCQPRENGDPTTINGSTGLPASRDTVISQVEFTLPAGQSVFELLLRDQGTADKIFVSIDGVFTNSTGYTTTLPGTFCYQKFTLPSSASDRVIRLITSNRPFGGLNVETGGTIGAIPTPRVIGSMAFMGDSITAGSVATQPSYTWAAIAAQALGVDNYINLGIGGSGYRKRYPYTSVSITATSGSGAVTVNSGTLTAGHKIDGLATAEGLFPYDTTVVTGATSGGTATLSAAATASGTFTIMDQTGYNHRDRIARDVLQCVNGGPPDALVIASGINDLDVVTGTAFSAAAIGAQALAIFQALRAASADMPIFVVGPWTDYNNPTYPASLVAGRDAIFAAAAQVARVHTIDVSGVVTVANRDTIFNGTVNGPHPIDAGHQIYGSFVAAAMAAYINTY